MRSVGLKVLKNKLSEYVRLVERGETVLITDRDRVVAEITPPRPGRAEFVSDVLLADAVRQGWITPPLMPAEGVPQRAPSRTLKSILRELDEDRDDR